MGVVIHWTSHCLATSKVLPATLTVLNECVDYYITLAYILGHHEHSKRICSHIDIILTVDKNFVVPIENKLQLVSINNK